MDIKKVDKRSLRDIQTVKIDTSAHIAKRMRSYIDQIGNPYCFLCEKTPVRIRFSDTGKNLDKAVKDHYLAQKALL